MPYNYLLNAQVRDHQYITIKDIVLWLPVV